MRALLVTRATTSFLKVWGILGLVFSGWCVLLGLAHLDAATCGFISYFRGGVTPDTLGGLTLLMGWIVIHAAPQCLGWFVRREFLFINREEALALQVTQRSIFDNTLFYTTGLAFLVNIFHVFLPWWGLLPGIIVNIVGPTLFTLMLVK